VGEKLMTDKIADEVLEHSEDEGEWDENPEKIERRPSGTQVFSARLPTDLAQRLLETARDRDQRPSDLVREAVEQYLTAGHQMLFVSVSAQPGDRLRMLSDQWGVATEIPAVTQPSGLADLVYPPTRVSLED
jgi:predicted DNA-binding protein